MSIPSAHEDYYRFSLETHKNYAVNVIDLPLAV
jgi:hypothetical protein